MGAKLSGAKLSTHCHALVIGTTLPTPELGVSPVDDAMEVALILKQIGCSVQTLFGKIPNRDIVDVCTTLRTKLKEKHQGPDPFIFVYISGGCRSTQTKPAEKIALYNPNRSDKDDQQQPAAPPTPANRPHTDKLTVHMIRETIFGKRGSARESSGLLIADIYNQSPNGNRKAWGMICGPSGAEFLHVGQISHGLLTHYFLSALQEKRDKNTSPILTLKDCQNYLNGMFLTAPVRVISNIPKFGVCEPGIVAMQLTNVTVWYTIYFAVLHETLSDIPVGKLVAMVVGHLDILEPKVLSVHMLPRVGFQFRTSVKLSVSTKLKTALQDHLNAYFSKLDGPSCEAFVEVSTTGLGVSVTRIDCVNNLLTIFSDLDLNKLLDDEAIPRITTMGPYRYIGIEVNTDYSEYSQLKARIRFEEYGKRQTKLQFQLETGPTTPGTVSISGSVPATPSKTRKKSLQYGDERVESDGSDDETETQSVVNNTRTAMMEIVGMRFEDSRFFYDTLKQDLIKVDWRRQSVFIKDDKMSPAAPPPPHSVANSSSTPPPAQPSTPLQSTPPAIVQRENSSSSRDDKKDKKDNYDVVVAPSPPVAAAEPVSRAAPPPKKPKGSNSSRSSSSSSSSSKHSRGGGGVVPPARVTTPPKDDDGGEPVTVPSNSSTEQPNHTPAPPSSQPVSLANEQQPVSNVTNTPSNSNHNNYTQPSHSEEIGNGREVYNSQTGVQVRDTSTSPLGHLIGHSVQQQQQQHNELHLPTVVHQDHVLYDQHDHVIYELGHSNPYQHVINAVQANGGDGGIRVLPLANTTYIPAPADSLLPYSGLRLPAIGPQHDVVYNNEGEDISPVRQRPEQYGGPPQYVLVPASAMEGGNYPQAPQGSAHSSPYIMNLIHNGVWWNSSEQHHTNRNLYHTEDEYYNPAPTHNNPQQQQQQQPMYSPHPPPPPRDGGSSYYPAPAQPQNVSPFGSRPTSSYMRQYYLTPVRQYPPAQSSSNGYRYQPQPPPGGQRGSFSHPTARKLSSSSYGGGSSTVPPPPPPPPPGELPEHIVCMTPGSRVQHPTTETLRSMSCRDIYNYYCDQYALPPNRLVLDTLSSIQGDFTLKGWLAPSSVSLGDFGILPLLHVFSRLHQLEWLYLPNQKIGNKGAEWLSRCLVDHNHVHDCDLSNNPLLDDKGASYLLFAVCCNPRVARIDLSGCSASPDSVDYIRRVCNDNRVGMWPN